MSKDSKKMGLKLSNTFNRHSDKISDPLFSGDDFFDPNDLLQVKYEMLRKVSKENWKISKAAKSFGFSRLSFYKIQARFEEAGLEGLIAKKRGPKSAHKLTDEIMIQIARWLKQDAQLSVNDIIKKIKDEFNILVHKRTVERALLRQKKKQITKV